MTLYDPLWLQGGNYSGQEDRQLIAVLGDAGVTGAGDLAVTQKAGGAAMSVDVAAGSCIIPGSTGAFLCHSDAGENRTITAAPSPGNQRIDVVYAQIREGTSDWIIAVQAGAQSATPVAPAIPTTAIALARITLTSSTTSITTGTITEARRQSTASPVWPIEDHEILGPRGATATAVTWDSIVIPAPNRPVTVLAWGEGSFACGAGEFNIVTELAIRAEWGAGPTSVTPSGMPQISANDVSPVAVPRTERFTCTPGVGEEITISLRVKTGAGTANFDRGRLVIKVCPT